MKLPIINGTYDQSAREAFKKNPNTAVSFFLMASFCYYCLYESVLEDTTYDKLAKYLLDNYDSLDHPHKHLFDKGDLGAGTLYKLKGEEYPLIVQVTAQQLVRDLLEHKNMTGENQK